MSNIFARLMEESQKQQAQLQPTASPESVSQHPTPTTAAFRHDSMTARQQAAEVARQPDSKPSRQHDSLQAYLLPFLQTRSLNKTTLRYPQALMDELDEVLYQAKKTYHKPLSKNALFVLALAALLHDFKRNATRSLIYQTLIETLEK